MNDNRLQNIVIVGATSAIAEHCARFWVKNANLILIARNMEKTKIIAADLKVRNPLSNIQLYETDFTSPEKISELSKKICAEQMIDTVLIAHGMLNDQTLCQNDMRACYDALAINGISPILFAESFVAEMQKTNHGTLAIIGSVAGDRGRKSNYIYGAAKGMLEKYTEGLAHRFAKTKVKIILIKPGPTDTPMTHEFKQKGVKLAAVQDVANDIVTKISQGKAVIYTPIKWAVIMTIIKYLPKPIFHKMDI